MKAHINTVVEIDQIDEVADGRTQVEIVPELGFAGTYKLYIHQDGRTIVRVCKLNKNQIKIESL